MFLATTGLTQHCVGSAMDEQPEKPIQQPNNPHYQRGEKAKEFVNEFLDLLPKLPSHYCGRGISKLYLEPQFRAITDLHCFYATACSEKGYPILRLRTFSEMLSSKKISLFQPKKDSCDICMGFETGNVDKEFWTKHMNDKRRAEEEKAKDKKEAQERNGNVMICKDLQGVLLAPSINISSSYFKMKLAVHNFTLKNMVTLCAMYGMRQRVNSRPTSLQAALLITCHLYQGLTKSFCIALVGLIKTKILYWPVHYLRFPYSENMKFNRNTL
ncbi:hypothetical protein PoB_005127700 [Plakobranchus ocellatus]|uniref:Uncharacterized protein n=1 Tax=Plakobranchus ocellatus TaxID=259542 RepID=A0AAV4C091_9GAST|nr:hypothetical protein PoB_005127700 [Plakobranchus ocellatus]